MSRGEKVNKYRPPNWEKIITNIIVTEGVKLWYGNIGAPIQDTLERGADALLDALRELSKTQGFINWNNDIYVLIPDDPVEKENSPVPFARYDIKFVKNRTYDFYDQGWYGIGNYLYNVPPKPSKEVIEEGHFCLYCGQQIASAVVHYCDPNWKRDSTRGTTSITYYETGKM